MRKSNKAAVDIVDHTEHPPFFCIYFFPNNVWQLPESTGGSPVNGETLVQKFPFPPGRLANLGGGFNKDGKRTKTVCS